MVAVQAYGHEGLGILAVAGVPSFPELRQKLLPLTAKFAVRALWHKQRHLAMHSLGSITTMLMAVQPSGEAFMLVPLRWACKSHVDYELCDETQN